MPYTSPSQLSPTASYPTTPTLSRNGFYACSSEASAYPNLPRSTSYMHRHRRTPSLSKAINFAAPRPVTNLDYHIPGLGLEASADGRDQSAARPRLNLSPSLHQSPPPITDSAIPTGVIISPPDSAQNSSDDESVDRPEESRGRQIEELHEAIMIIKQHRDGSPNSKADSERREQDEEQVKLAYQVVNSPVFESPIQSPSSTSCSREALPKDGRKISHSRSSTESSIPLDKRAESPDSSDLDDDAYRLTKKPVMVRKKSGELVKPALRPSAYRRPSSVPGTPTYSKAVHFDSHLEHVRHFLQVDKPLAVSAGSSPTESYETEAGFPFADDDCYLRSPPFGWEIVLPNFPRETIDRKLLPVRVERVFLSSDNKSLIGTVACANLDYSKLVVARFTLDFWKTTSEVIAEYNNDVRRRHRDDGYDRFNFTIELEDRVNLEKKTLFFCVRYNVKGQEFWDNNGSFNYRVDFRKKTKPQSGTNDMPGVGSRALPRSRPLPPISSRRPVSLPASFDDLIDSLGPKYDFGLKKLPLPRVISDTSSSTPRLKSSSSLNGVTRDSRTPKPGQAFGNRYDFSASLSAAIQASNRQADDESRTPMRDRAEKTPRAVSSGNSVESQGHSKFARATAPLTAPEFVRKNDPSSLSNKNVSSSIQPSVKGHPNHLDEILDKYCFFGSAKRPQPPIVDGPADYASSSDSSAGFSHAPTAIKG
ncbi:hypothetical protein FGG08_005098 [Glutinoglossum americanum]|uniref:CBM21 domain-containing protein n=1 Tax=Glutinoglossum americanum TaxID=1670608 RepID=A0A9P8HV44_9PEZI|nr:hypothetical protein FGG08_005098 [Glutinoglossum americanum]